MVTSMHEAAGFMVDGHYNTQQAVHKDRTPQVLERYPHFVSIPLPSDENGDNGSDTDSLHAEPDYVSRGTTLRLVQNTQHGTTEPSAASNGNGVSTALGVSDNDNDASVSMIGPVSWASNQGEITPIGPPDGLQLDEVGPTLPGPEEFEKRFVHSAFMGRAPFSKPHIITPSDAAPFSGPYTAIKIPLGIDVGMYLHIPKKLRAAEISMAKLAMYWLWTGLRYHGGRNVEAQATSVAMAPPSPHQILGHKMMGPPAAPFSMTTTANPPFVGPRTWIRNLGKRLHGWILHIPRFLTKEQIAIASQNLRRTCSRGDPDGWAV
jgi:hypothetical protein